MRIDQSSTFFFLLPLEEKVREAGLRGIGVMSSSMQNISNNNCYKLKTPSSVLRTSSPPRGEGKEVYIQLHRLGVVLT